MSCSTPITKRLQPTEILARITGWADTPIKQSDIASIAWSAFILEQATGEENAVTGYQALALSPVSSYVENSLLLNSKWTEDEIGYNFHFVIPGAVFSERGQVYLIRVTFTPSTVGEEPFQAIFILEVE